jgi:ElaB/YqjD/DUF883 family membrane-anchored ribosome-binding protein
MNRDEQVRRPLTDPDAVVVRETEVTVISDADDTAQLQAEIDQTRANMSETIDALQERLSPSNLKEQAQEQIHDVTAQVKEQVREQIHEAKQAVRDATIGRVENIMQTTGDTVNEARYTTMETIRQNPLPAALIGIGLGWLWMNRRSAPPARVSGRGGVRGGQFYDGRSGRYVDNRGRYDYGYQPGYYVEGGPSYVERGQSAVSGAVDRVQESAGNLAGTVSDKASSVASTVSDTASNLVDSAQDRAADIADRAQYQAQRVEDRFQTTLQDNPLAVAAVALALGTAVGLSLPQTERENQLMGEARDQLVGRAQELASDTIDKVQRVAGEVASDAKETVKEQAREQGLT